MRSTSNDGTPGRPLLDAGSTDLDSLLSSRSSYPRESGQSALLPAAAAFPVAAPATPQQNPGGAVVPDGALDSSEPIVEVREGVTVAAPDDLPRLGHTTARILLDALIRAAERQRPPPEAGRARQGAAVQEDGGS
jgi:hypothetical protein